MYDIKSKADQDKADKFTVTSLSNPCTTLSGKHALYFNAGPGGKRDYREGWLCCESCGANGPAKEADDSTEND